MHEGRQCTGPIELLDAGLGDVLKGTLPRLGGGVNPFFCVVACWQGVKIREGWLKLRSFQCIRGGNVLAPMSCRTLGWAMCQKPCHLALAKAPMYFFASYHVGKV